MRTRVASLFAITIAVLMAAFGTANAQRPDRQGKEVVDAVCLACHGSGKDGAPRIGDVAAWSLRASQGLTGLTAHAIAGIRKMPAHGGSAGVSDAELERAIVYMVNHSGGNWIEPLAAGARAVRTSESIVNEQCAKCHRAGKDGAPKIGDRQAWTPRLSKGLDNLVASAVHGHGPMPARGGIADLERDDIRHAILYMFNYGLPPAPAAPPMTPADPHHKLVSGMDVYFGMMRAESMRSQAEAAKLTIPAGRNYYHLNISLEDNRTQKPVTDAEITMRVSDGMSVETKPLARLAANNAVSYGNFFKFSSGSSYNITTEIRRAGVPGSVTASFEFRAP